MKHPHRTHTETDITVSMLSFISVIYSVYLNPNTLSFFICKSLYVCVRCVFNAAFIYEVDQRSNVYIRNYSHFFRISLFHLRIYTHTCKQLQWHNHNQRLTVSRASTAIFAIAIPWWRCQNTVYLTHTNASCCMYNLHSIYVTSKKMLFAEHDKATTALNIPNTIFIHRINIVQGNT